MTDDEIKAALKAAHACCSPREVAAVRSLFAVRPSVVGTYEIAQQVVYACDHIAIEGPPRIQDGACAECIAAAILAARPTPEPAAGAAVERVARAICQTAGRDPDALTEDGTGIPYWQLEIRYAEAALRAARGDVT